VLSPYLDIGEDKWTAFNRGTDLGDSWDVTAWEYVSAYPWIGCRGPIHVTDRMNHRDPVLREEIANLVEITVEIP
jgi:hypothetical protein